MSFFHSTPAKIRKHRPNQTKSFFRDFSEWSLNLDIASDSVAEEWVFVDPSDIPAPSKLVDQNDGKVTPGQRIIMGLRAFGYIFCKDKDLVQSTGAASKQPAKKRPLPIIITWDETSQYDSSSLSYPTNFHHRFDLICS